MGANHDALRKIVQDLLQAMLEAEMIGSLGASKSERADGRVGYRSGHYNRTLVTRVASSSCECPKAVTGGSRPSYSSAISRRNRRSWHRWQRCTCRVFRPAR
ncbi:hypothetical protein NOVOSPHI9U_50485 [Novosphingobium sp. 9U]|nr:hypothetical protein NOVOSPHI9U_50485 [Novosphingobium sp. 9U]